MTARPETPLNTFERHLKAALHDCGLLNPDGSLPCLGIPSECVSLLPYPKAMELLRTMRLQVSPLVLVVVKGLVNRLRADTLALPPDMLTQLDLDMVITAAAGSNSTATTYLTSAIAQLHRAQTSPALDINAPSAFNN
jgi:hypothetical protein